MPSKTGAHAVPPAGMMLVQRPSQRSRSNQPHNQPPQRRSSLHQQEPDRQHERQPAASRSSRGTHRPQRPQTAPRDPTRSSAGRDFTSNNSSATAMARKLYEYPSSTSMLVTSARNAVIANGARSSSTTSQPATSRTRHAPPNQVDASPIGNSSRQRLEAGHAQIVVAEQPHAKRHHQRRHRHSRRMKADRIARACPCPRCKPSGHHLRAGSASLALPGSSSKTAACSPWRDREPTPQPATSRPAQARAATTGDGPACVRFGPAAKISGICSI